MINLEAPRFGGGPPGTPLQDVHDRLGTDAKTVLYVLQNIV